MIDYGDFEHYDPDPMVGYSYSEWSNKHYSAKKWDPLWGQGSPYNDYTPIVNGKQALVGCVPVAVAMLMSCWEYPAVFENKNLYWDVIKQSPTPPQFSSARSMVGLFLRDLGRSKYLDVTYGNGDDDEGTSADPDNITRTLEKAGFSKKGSRADYKESTVNEELMIGYPILAGGQSFKHSNGVLGINFFYTYSGGHRWLIDELLQRKRTRYYYVNNILSSTSTQTEYLVYCNWGWGGKDNGYYYHKQFDTNKGGVPTRSGEDYNYQYKVDMYTGVRK